MKAYPWTLAYCAAMTTIGVVLQLSHMHIL